MNEAIRTNDEQNHLLSGVEATLFEPTTGWIIFQTSDEGYAQCFSTGDVLNFRKRVVEQLHRVNDGEVMPEFLDGVGNVGPDSIRELIDLARQEQFRSLDDLTDCFQYQNPNRLWIEVQGQCNERCIHCYAESEPADLPELSSKQVRSIVEQADSIGFESIQFTGGDPLLWNSLPEMVRLTRDKSMTPEIFTNGLELTGALLKQLEPARPTFSFSVYSHDARTHNRITNTPGSWKQTRDAIKRAVASESAVRVSVIIMEENKTHAGPTKEFLTQLGVKSDHISSNVVQGVGRGDSLDQDMPQERSTETVSTNSGHSGQARQSFNPGKICVTYEGNVVPCIFQRWIRLGNIDNRPLKQIMEAPQLEQNQPDTSNDPLGRDSYSCSECQFQYVLLKHLLTQSDALKTAKTVEY